MSALVDVLVIMDDTADSIRSHWGADVAQPMREARSAVAQLIRTLRSSRTVLAAALEASAPDLFETEEDIASHIQIKKIDEALARVGGAA